MSVRLRLDGVRPAGLKSSPLRGSRVLITGASSGIGAALATALVDRGAVVAVTGRSPEGLERVSGAACEMAADLTVPGEVERVVTGSVEGLGGLDVMVSCAGAGWSGPFESMTQRDIDALIDLNLRAPMHLIRASLPYLSPGSRLVLVGSIAGLVGAPGEAAYSATKAGLVGLADALRAELTTAGIGVTLVSPGVVDTAFFARRNRPYERQVPRPIPASRVASAIVGAIELGRPEVIVPRWLGWPARLHGAVPGLYRALSRRFS